jgi:hypothetical protein
MLCAMVVCVVWQCELLGHEVWLTGGSKPKDRHTHNDRALARYYDLEAVRTTYLSHSGGPQNTSAQSSQEPAMIEA